MKRKLLMTCFRNEFQFQSAVIKQLTNFWAYVRNIADIANVRKPFDISMNYMWKWWALELKHVTYKSWVTPERVMAKLYPHQIANLLQFCTGKSQGVSLIITYNASDNTVRVHWVQQVNWQVSLIEINHFERDDECMGNILYLFL